ncbi:MAG: DSD1 family PLP-dependent enzyme [Alphaproteobacteria bacterium]
MHSLNAPLVGKPGSAALVATPALVIELPALERNIKAMQAFCDGKGLKLRPHAKTHKSAEIARRQSAAGAVGICCAKLGEAEALADAGIDGILVTSPVVTAQAFARVAGLNARLSDFMIVVDSAAGVDGLAKAAAASGKVLKVLLDLDIGLHRTGVMPGAPAMELAQRIRAQASLSFQGLQAYAGHLQHVESHADRKGRNLSALAQVSVMRDLLAAENIACPIISGGGTGTFTIDAETRVFTELQAGSYVFMDKQYDAVKVENDEPLPFETSLFVHTTVISSTMPGLVTTDAGLKSFATEAGPPAIASGAFEGANYFFFGDEQGGVMLGGADRALAPGSVLRCTTPHCDPTVNLYDSYHVVDGEQLSAIWPIEARGRSA